MKTYHISRSACWRPPLIPKTPKGQRPLMTPKTPSERRPPMTPKMPLLNEGIYEDDDFHDPS